MKQSLIVILTGAVLAAACIALHWLGRSSPAVLAPNLLRFWVAAIILGIIQGFEERSAPALSVRLLSSSVVAGVLFLAIPNTLWLWASRGLAASYLALSMAVIPLWAHCLYHRRDRRYLVAALASLFGLLIAATPILGQSHRHWEQVAGCLIAAFSSSGAAFLARHLFWIHSNINLNLWSMVFSAALLLPLTLLNGEFALLSTWPSGYWLALAIVTVIFTALGAYYYRKVSFRIARPVWLLVAVPVMVYAVQIFRGVETLHPIPLLGWAVVLVSVALVSRHGSSQYWMLHYLANSNRQGDRLEINLKGFLKSDKSSGSIRITSISIGGLGFESSFLCPVAEKAIVTIPLGKNFTQVSFDTVCAYSSRHAQLPNTWSGGLAFEKMNLETTQLIAEFVARLNHVTFTEEPAVEIRKEYA